MADANKTEKASSMAEIVERSDEELKSSLGRAREELFRLKLGRYTNQLENVMQIRNKRREIARILTAITARAKKLTGAKA
jgi:large subunit ribosomal protein L29